VFEFPRCNCCNQALHLKSFVWGYSDKHGKLHKLRTTSNVAIHRSLQHNMPGVSADDESVYGSYRNRTEHA
jgi:hypothetical protein